MGLDAAFAHCVEPARDRPAGEMAVALASKDQVAGALAGALGADAVRALDRDNVYIRKGLTLYLLTQKIQRRRVQGPVLAVGLPVALLDSVVAAQGVTEMVFVPNSGDDLVDYLARFPTSEVISASGPGRRGSPPEDSRQAPWGAQQGQR